MTDRIDWRAKWPEAAALVYEKRGDIGPVLAALSERWGRSVPRAAIESASARHGGKHLAALLEDARHAAPPPGGVSVLEPARPVFATNAPPVEGLDWRGARPQTSSAVERRLVLGDMHIPAHSATAVACAYAIARALQPRHIILVGDVVNGSAFSHHGTHSPEAERYDLAMQAARSVLRSLRRASPGSAITLIRGNHDDWASRYEAENPGMQNLLDFEVQLGTRSAPDDDRPPMLEGVKVVRHTEDNPLVLGPVAYIHGTGGGMHYCKRYAETIAPLHGVRTLVAGHHHTVQAYAAKNGCTAWGCGWLGNEKDPAFHYAPPPRGWRVGVLVQDVEGDLVSTTFVPIVGGRALFGGRIISGALS